MPTDMGTLGDFVTELEQRIEEKGLSAVPLDTIAPICIYLFADTEWEKEARKAFAKLKRAKHRVLAIKEVGKRDEFGQGFEGPTRFVIPGDLSFADLHRNVDPGRLDLLYRQALMAEISKHLDPSEWRVQVEYYGAWEIVNGDASGFTGDDCGDFAWYGDAKSVASRCRQLAEGDL